METFHLYLKKIPSGKGNYLAGFTDGDGCFYVSIDNIDIENSRISCQLRFSVSQKEKFILSQFKKYLKCGKITKDKKRDGIYLYEVFSFNEIQTNVIPFFQQFGFLSFKKKRDFAKFQQIAKLIQDKEHLTKEGIQKILYIREDMNDGGIGHRKYSYKKIFGEHPPDLGSFSYEKFFGEPPSDLENYLAGFTDAEGSFNVSIKKRKDYKIPLKTSICFNVSQKDSVILSEFQKYLKCGTIRERRKDGLHLYEVNNFSQIQTIVIPFFNRYAFLSEKKQQNFEKFQQIAKMMEKKKHLTVEGIQKIIEIREDMNDGGKRKYSNEELLRILRDYTPDA